MTAAFGKQPLGFEINHGQTDSRVKFLARGPGYSLFLTPTEAVMALNKPAGQGHCETSLREKGRMAANPTQSRAVVRMRLAGGNPAPQIQGRDELSTKINYLIGNDPNKWRTVSSYGKVEYKGVYPGVDLVYYGNQRQLEFDFVVAPGADPKAIRLAFTGARKLKVDAAGNLILHTASGPIQLHRPVIYQEVGNIRREIAGSYVLTGKYVGFDLGDYDAARPLVIDPTVVYATYLGGCGADRGLGITVDASGEAYVTGFTQSTDFPMGTPLQPANGGGTDAFVAKLNSDASAFVFSTYLGGSGIDSAYGIALDPSGNVYVAGETSSTNFPTVNPLQPANGGGIDAFVTKLNRSGSALIYSIYLGGSGADKAFGIALETSGSAYVAGSTESTNFPTANPLQPGNGGGADAFVARINADGSALDYSTYIGGNASDSAAAIAVQSSEAYVTGSTDSTNFPIANALQPGSGGGIDSFVAKLNATGTSLAYSTYLGGSREDRGAGIAVDSSNAYLTGWTDSTNFPTANALQPANSGTCPKGSGFVPCPDAFVAKLNSAGSALVYSTYLGGTREDKATGIALDEARNVYVTGYTGSRDFPNINSFQFFYGGDLADAFVAKLDSTGSAFLYSSYHGRTGEDRAFALAVDPSGSVYLTGETESVFFGSFGVVQPLRRLGCGAFDGFVHKISTHAPAATAIRVRDKSVFASFSSVDSSGCVMINVFVFGSQITQHQSQGISSDVPNAGVFIEQFDLCRGISLTSASGIACFFNGNDFICSPRNLQVSTDLSSATLTATIPVSDAIKNSVYDVSINLTWTATGPLDHFVEGGAFILPGLFVSAGNFNGEFRPAQASGSVTAGTTNFTPDPSFDALISSLLAGGVGVQPRQ